MILHSDQRSVYVSKAFNELLPMYGITYSKSLAGTPTDNAAMEAINGWIKAELFMDIHVTGDKPVQNEIDDYILFFNEQRPAYSLKYLTPKQVSRVQFRRGHCLISHFSYYDFFAMCVQFWLTCANMRTSMGLWDGFS